MGARIQDRPGDRVRDGRVSERLGESPSCVVVDDHAMGLAMQRLLKQAGGIPAYGNQRTDWDAGARFDYENPEYR